jgi:histone H3/H4
MLLNDTKSGTTLNKWQFWFHIYENTSRQIYPTLKDFVEVVFGDSVKTKPGTSKQVATGVAAKNPVFDFHGNIIGCVSYGVPLEIKDGAITVITVKEKAVDCLYVTFPGEKNPFGKPLKGYFKLNSIQAFYSNKNVEKVIGGQVSLNKGHVKPGTAENEALTALGTIFYTYLKHNGVNWSSDDQYTNAFIQYINCLKENVSSYQIDNVTINVNDINNSLGNAPTYLNDFKTKTFEQKWYRTSVITGKFLYEKVLKSILKNSVSFGGSFQIYMRESDAIMRYIFAKLNPLLNKQIISLNGNKWNPADMWIKTGKSIKELSDYIDEVKEEHKQEPSRALILINAKMLELYNGNGNNKLIPISLKKLGENVHVKVVNDTRELDADPDKLYDLDVKYKGIRVSKSSDVNLYIDMTATYKIGGKIIKDDIQVVARPFADDLAQLQVEKVSGASAVFGKIGSKPSQTLISLNDSGAMNRIKAYRRAFEKTIKTHIKEKYNIDNKIVMKFNVSSDNFIMTAGKAANTDAKNIVNQIEKILKTKFPKASQKKLKEDAEKMFEELASKYITSIFSKVGVDSVHAGRIQARIQSVEYAYVVNSSKQNRDAICEAIYRYGTSQGVSVITKDAQGKKQLQKLAESSIHVIVY